MAGWNKVNGKPGVVVPSRSLRIPTLPPSRKTEIRWFEALYNGEWSAACRVIAVLARQPTRIKAIFGSTRTTFQVDEAVTNLMGVTERGCSDDGVLWCRLTDFGHELARVMLSEKSIRSMKKRKERVLEKKIEDAISGK